jgi:hypothetical protein
LGEGLSGRGDGGDLTNVQYKPNQIVTMNLPCNEFIIS